MNRRKFITISGTVSLSALAGCNGNNNSEPGKPVSEATPPENYEPAYIGSEDADLVIQEFFDFGCPACAQFHDTVYPYVYSDYITEGTVALEMYDYPFGAGDATIPAANGGREVWYSEGQEAYTEYVDLVYENQGGFGEDSLVQWGVDLGVAEEDMRSAIEEEAYADELDSALEYGSNLGVEGTPTVRVADRLYSFPSFEQLSGYIESELGSSE